MRPSQRVERMRRGNVGALGLWRCVGRVGPPYPLLRGGMGQTHIAQIFQI